MRAIGLVLLLAGFFAASFVSVMQADSAGLEWQTVPWTWYGISFAVGVVGVVMLRAAARQVSTHAHKVAREIGDVSSSLDVLVQKIGNLIAQRDAIGVYGMHTRIDDELVDDLNRFVEARESIAHVHGLNHYAEVMTRFATAERYINRAWSASADGYIDETWKSLDTAANMMTAARDEYASVAE